MSKILAIYGSGGFGREVLEIAYRINATKNIWNQFIFISDIADKKRVDGIDVYRFDDLNFHQNIEFVVAVGSPKVREMLYSRLKDKCAKMATLIHPQAIISPNATIKEGTIICEFASIHTNVKIGCNCVIQPYSLLGHDITIGNHTVLSARFSPGGNCVVGNGVFAGACVSIKERLTIGDNATLSMGSAILKDVKKDSMVFGNPARTTLRSDDTS